MPDNERVVREFIAAWSRLDPAELASCFTRTKTEQGDVDLPCLGVFEMEDGRIREWRDYFDLATFMKAMG